MGVMTPREAADGVDLALNVVDEILAFVVPGVAEEEHSESPRRRRHELRRRRHGAAEAGIGPTVVSVALTPVESKVACHAGTVNHRGADSYCLRVHIADALGHNASVIADYLIRRSAKVPPEHGHFVIEPVVQSYTGGVALNVVRPGPNKLRAERQ